jgi:GNT-I family
MYSTDRLRGYRRLAAHYRWALHTVFESSEIQRVIILEEDLEVCIRSINCIVQVATKAQSTLQVLLLLEQ